MAYDNCSECKEMTSEVIEIKSLEDNDHSTQHDMVFVFLSGLFDNPKGPENRKYWTEALRAILRHYNINWIMVNIVISSYSSHRFSVAWIMQVTFVHALYGTVLNVNNNRTIQGLWNTCKKYDGTRWRISLLFIIRRNTRQLLG